MSSSAAAADDDAAAPRGGGEGGGGGDGDEEEEEEGAAEEEPEDEEEAEEYDSDEDAVRARVLVKGPATSRRASSVPRVLVCGAEGARRVAMTRIVRDEPIVPSITPPNTVTRRHRCSRSTNRRCGSRRVPMSCECSRSCRKTRRSARCDGMECAAVKDQRRSPRSAAGGQTRRSLLAIRRGPECAEQCSVA
jgi:hypothetical protein